MICKHGDREQCHACYMRRYRSNPINAAKHNEAEKARYAAKIGRQPRPRSRPLAERFWEKVEKTETCWLWTGGKSGPGYGVIWANGRLAPAHRVSLILAGSPPSADLEVDHLCRVPLCVRPDHLEPVTHAENMRRGLHHNQHTVTR